MREPSNRSGTPVALWIAAALAAACAGGSMQAVETFTAGRYTVSLQTEEDPDSLYSSISRIVKGRHAEWKILTDDPGTREFEATRLAEDGGEIWLRWHVAPHAAGSEMKIEARVTEHSRIEVQEMVHSACEEVFAGREISWVAD